ncbi:DUF421 domain-containing protein [Sphingomonas sp. JC676]|uniref:DUF421 domain-containing protein n=1 Tax=Sphingomonas sp. JC676 TaxID=2768065 RepID=UPI001657E59C|nr:YetF domain-containing protein [Sphingomonas sp. JC676]MBC9031286.1 DUF421 domain-containing protein [Sphingomonas sp. JC676]
MRFHEIWTAAFGVSGGTAQIDPWQAAARAALLYVATLTLIRLGKKRFLGRGTPFDVVIAIVIGSIAARAILGGSPILPSLAAIATLIALHWLFSLGAMRSRGIGLLVKGRNRVLVCDGVVDEAAMRDEHLTMHDLEEDLRERGYESLDPIAMVRIERNGKLSFVEKRKL